MDVGENHTSLQITSKAPHSQRAESLAQVTKRLKINLALTITYNIQIALQDKKTPPSHPSFSTGVGCHLSFEA